MKLPRDRQALTILASLAGGLGLLVAFIMLTEEVFEGDTRRFDEWLLSAIRTPDDRAVTVLPRWLESAALDVTALGGTVVLGLTVLAIAGYLVLHGLWRNGLFVVVAGAGGWVLNWVLKAGFDRARPDVVPHLREVMSSSFPSGHAMTSAAVYLTLGALLTRVAQGRLAKIYCLAVAILVTFLVGSSRVVLGVHYPSDVLAGWLVGTSWALLCLTIEMLLEKRAGLRREQRAHQEGTPDGSNGADSAPDVRSRTPDERGTHSPGT